MKIMKIPMPTGEYAVGTFTYTVKDDREDVMAPGTMRSVAARVYYPVLKESVKGLKKTVALSENMIKGFKSAFFVAPNFKDNPEANLSECYTDQNLMMVHICFTIKALPKNSISPCSVESSLCIS